MRALRPYFWCFVSCFFLLCSLPPSHYGQCVWIALCPLYWLIWHAPNRKSAFLRGYGTGVLFWIINLRWLATVSIFAPLLLGGYLALYIGLWSVFAWHFSPTKRKSQETSYLSASLHQILSSLICAAGWVGFEWLRGILFTGFGWNGLGVSFHHTPILSQCADLIGVTGLSFLPALSGFILLSMLMGMLDAGKRGKRLLPHLDLALLLLLILCAFFYGIYRVQRIQQADSIPLRALLIQGNIAQHTKWDPNAVEKNLNHYVHLTQEALEELEKTNAKKLQNTPEGTPLLLERPDIILWPESALPLPVYSLKKEKTTDFFFLDLIKQALENVFSMTPSPLLTGSNEVEAFDTGDRIMPTVDGKNFNSLFLLNATKVLGSYQKIHLVLFGETIPFAEKVPFLKKLFSLASGMDFSGNFSKGTSTKPLKLPVANQEVLLLPCICFEDTVGRLLRTFVSDKKPQVIVNITNDGWFKKSEANRVHFANARFRCIELRMPMLRCANTGVTAMISPTGSLQAPDSPKAQILFSQKHTTFFPGSLYGSIRVPLALPKSFYARFGDLFSIVCCITSLLSLSIHFFLKRKTIC